MNSDSLPTTEERTAIGQVVEICIGSVCGVEYQIKTWSNKRGAVEEVLEPFDTLSRQRILALAGSEHYQKTKPHDYCD